MNDSNSSAFGLTLTYRGTFRRFLAVPSPKVSDPQSSWQKLRLEVDGLATHELDPAGFYEAVQSALKKAGFSQVRE